MDYSNYGTLKVEQKDQGIMIVSLNRPSKLNAMNMQMLEELVDIWHRMRRDLETRVVILRGEGEKGFCGGMDVGDILKPETFGTKESVPDIYDIQLLLGEAEVNMRKMPQPVICVVHGAAAGAGFSFALASDIRVISPDARFSAAFLNVGIAGADMGSSYFLPRLIGAGRAYEFLLTGRWMNAEEAMNLGFASRCVEKDKLMDTAMEFAADIAKRDTIAIRLTKEAINQNLDCGSLENAIIMENRNQNMMLSHLANKMRG